MRVFQDWSEEWAAAALRVAKPGAHLLAFGGTRTFHRLAVAIEDAGWEIRDTIMWVYGSGFPKSHNLEGDKQGWGTALKPAWEPIIVARKPLTGTVSANVQQWGVGAINVDGCRVAFAGTQDAAAAAANAAMRASADQNANRKVYGGFKIGHGPESIPAYVNGIEDRGRWPANLIHDGSDEVLAGFPGDAGACARASGPTLRDGNDSVARGHFNGMDGAPAFHGNSGSAARFFYCAKASAADREEGLQDIALRLTGTSGAAAAAAAARGEEYAGDTIGLNHTHRVRNHHPTVKPTALMRYLCRLVSPPGGLILDPFTGSGSTGKAAALEGFRFAGMDLSPEYIEIARARIEHALRTPQQLQLLAMV